MQAGILKADFDRNTGIDGKVSSKYVAVNSIGLIQHFEASGYTVRKASGRAVKGKHVFRLQHDALQFSGVDSYRPEIVIMNAYDGTSTLRLMLGVYRLICANGMTVGTTFQEYRIKHIGNNVMNQVTAAINAITLDAARLQATIAKFQGVVMTQTMMHEFARQCATNALSTLFKPDFTVNNTAALLQFRRTADANRDLWSVLNVVQENIVRYGFEVKNTLTGKISNIRSIKSATRDITVNKMLWDNAEKLAA